MPHCVLEYSANVKDSVNFQDFFASLHKLLADSGEIQHDQLKGRWYCSENYFVGDGSPKNAFVYLQISMLSGRTAELRKRLAGQAFELLSAQYPRSQRDLSCSITVEIREMDRETHFKVSKTPQPA
ncbi:MAG: 5-carboxymethyl-2-hydroxymuconate Delta-isomerase [Deltaproteobacteria bacterium]|nr:5-carboxymethyl-2-hydroxymuconate Delta-isomerase [Deltaproteobacteria bacterium]